MDDHRPQLELPRDQDLALGQTQRLEQKSSTNQAFSGACTTNSRWPPPAELDWVATRGIRVITPVAKVLEVPILGAAVRWAEHRLADLPGARDVGGFLVACCRRR